MKIEALTCPKCAAGLNIPEDRDFFTCESCGSKLRVDRPEIGPTRLTRFEVLLSRAVSQTKFLTAIQRLEILAGDLARANEAVTQAAASVEAATTERQTLDEKLRAAVKEKEGLTVVLVLLAIGAGFLTIQSLGGGSTLVWLLIAIGLSVGAWYNYDQRKHLVKEMPAKVQTAEEQINDARVRLAKAQADLQDLQLEEELCQRTKANFRMRGDDDLSL